MREKKAVSAETFVCIFAVIALFVYLGSVMGVSQMFDTIMNTAHDLLLDTVFFIMAVSVVTGALSSLLAEFGVDQAFYRPQVRRNDRRNQDDALRGRPRGKRRRRRQGRR